MIEDAELPENGHLSVEWFVQYPGGPLTERPPYMYEITPPWTEETALAEVSAARGRKVFRRERITYPDKVGELVEVRSSPG